MKKCVKHIKTKYPPCYTSIYTEHKHYISNETCISVYMYPDFLLVLHTLTHIIPFETSNRISFCNHQSTLQAGIH